MDRYIAIENAQGLVKDKITGAVINTNTSEIEQARERKRLRLAGKEEFENLKDDVGHLKHDMADIKTLLQQLVDK
jgi:hypothetical protein